MHYYPSSLAFPGRTILLPAVWMIFSLLITGCQAQNKTPNGAHSLEHGGQTRLFDVYLPQGYDAKKSYPVVMALHGGGGSREGFLNYSELTQYAADAGYILVSPEGVGNDFNTKNGPLTIASWNSYGCCEPAASQNIDDIGFLRKMLDFVEANYAVDASRIYATGHSNGGMLCYLIACELSDRVAAVAPVGAPAPEIPSCSATRHVPILVVHGTEDECARYNGGQCGGCYQQFIWDTYPLLGGLIFPRNKNYLRPCMGVPTLVNQIKTRYGLDQVQPVQLYKKGSTYAKTWTREGGKVELALCAVGGNGHTWPGGRYGGICDKQPNGRPCRNFKKVMGPISRDFIAGREILKWFQRHRL